jgi:hypothetical protein
VLKFTHVLQKFSKVLPLNSQGGEEKGEGDGWVGEGRGGDWKEEDGREGGKGEVRCVWAFARLPNKSPHASYV